MVVLMISLYGVFGLGGSRLLLPCFVYLPMVSFFIAFFFGQQLSFGLWSPSIWIDRLCIHQTDLDLKAEQIKSVPTFVARSSRMLVLCDGSYFERLLSSESTVFLFSSLTAIGNRKLSLAQVVVQPRAGHFCTAWRRG